MRSLRSHVARGGLTLDLGCAGGIRYLGDLSSVAGLDLSRASLEKVTQFYERAVQASALEMPFAKETFDTVVSAYMFEHLAGDEKDKLLSEIRKLLKPGGKAVLAFDCDTNNSLFKWFKKDSELYVSQFVEHDQHYGLERASINLDRFEKAGFEIAEIKGLNRTPLQYLAVYGWMEPYGEKSRLAKIASNLAGRISKNKLALATYNTAVNWFDGTIGRFFPLDNSRVLIVAARKKA